MADGTILAERSRRAEGNHAVSLLPLIEETLSSAGWSVGSLDAVAVSSGPGSFTGLRIAMSVAKGLACATGLRVVAVPTLEALAHTVSERSGLICVVLDARKGEIYNACFESDHDGVRRRTSDQLTTPAALLDTLPVPCTVLGDAVVAYGDLLRAHFGERITILPYDTHGPRGGVVARLGYERLQSGAAADAAALEPQYIRPSDAERNFT